MGIETAADRAIFLDADVFGEEITYTPTGGSASTIEGIFDNETQLEDVGGEVEFVVGRPRIMVRESDTPNAKAGDSVVINSVSYEVTYVLGDGLGMRQLFLEEQ